MPKKVTRSKEPATKADLDQAIGELAVATQQGFHHVDQRFDLIDQRFAAIDQRFEAADQRFERIEENIKVIKKDIVSLKSGQSAILSVVRSIDQQLKTHKDLPTRVARLERAIFH